MIKIGKSVEIELIKIRSRSERLSFGYSIGFSYHETTHNNGAVQKNLLFNLYIHNRIFCLRFSAMKPIKRQTPKLRINKKA